MRVNGKLPADWFITATIIKVVLFPLLYLCPVVINYNFFFFGKCVISWVCGFV